MFSGLPGRYSVASDEIYHHRLYTRARFNHAADHHAPSSFCRATQNVRAAQHVAGLRRPRSAAGHDAGRFRRDRRSPRVLSSDRRCHRRPGQRVQTAGGAFRRVGRGAGTEGADRLHPRPASHGAGHSRCKTRRRGCNRRALRDRGLRSVRRRRGHRESLSWSGELASVSQTDRQRGLHPLSYQQSGERVAAEPSRRTIRCFCESLAPPRNGTSPAT